MNPNLIKSFVIAGTLAAIGPVSAAVAGAPGDGLPKTWLQKIDSSGDGQISREEAATYPRLAKNFDQIDASKDGFLTPDEIKAQRAKMLAARLKAIDKDGDGRISRAEAEAEAPRLSRSFDQIDSNKDGQLTRDEIVAARKLAHGQR